jgi:hypothetical protein
MSSPHIFSAHIFPSRQERSEFGSPPPLPPLPRPPRLLLASVPRVHRQNTKKVSAREVASGCPARLWLALLLWGGGVGTRGEAWCEASRRGEPQRFALWWRLAVGVRREEGGGGTPRGTRRTRGAQAAALQARRRGRRRRARPPQPGHVTRLWAPYYARSPQEAKCVSLEGTPKGRGRRGEAREERRGPLACPPPKRYKKQAPLAFLQALYTPPFTLMLPAHTVHYIILRA